MIKLKKKKIIAFSLTAIISFSLCGCNKPGGKNEADVQAEFDAWLQEEFEESVTSDTITLHYTLAHPEDFGITPPEVTYGDFDFSEEGFEEAKKSTEDAIAKMEEFDYDKLTDDQQYTYDVIYEMLKVDLLSYDNPYFYEPLAYTSGLQSNLPITLSEYTFYDQGDVDDYIKLLELTPDYFQMCLDFEKTKSDKGYFMSDACADEVIRQCQEYIANPENNLLIDTFNDRIGDVPGLTDEQIEDYKTKNHDAVIDCIIPAYENMIETMTSLKGTGTNDLGLAHYEGGTDYYEYLLASKVGTDKTPDEVIELLEDKIDDSMDDLLDLAINNYSSYLLYMDNYDTLYADIDHEETIRFFEDCFTEKFPEIPEINFTIRPVHESLEGIVSPAFFMTPPMDDYENNSIYVNEGTDSMGSLWSTLAHEGIPGHMYQFVYFLSNDPEPIRTILNFTGYQEGWASYVETMSFEYYDGYSDDIFADLEKLNTELNLLVSARVEIGVNYEGWTIEETSEYLTDAGFDGSIAEEIVEYVIAEPANYQMYCLGWLEMLELREHAEDELGDKFDEVEFHKVILDAGPSQFFLIKEQVDEYIKENK